MIIVSARCSFHWSLRFSASNNFTRASIGRGVKPPYSRLTAIDLKTGEFAWQVPLGDGPRQRLIDMGVRDPGPLGGGNYTGPLVTKTLLFLGLGGGPRSGQAPVLIAFDKATGQIVHAVDVPANLTGTPMTYMAGGKQVHRGRLRRRPHGRSRRPGAALSVFFAQPSAPGDTTPL